MSVKEKERLIESLEQQINDTVYATERNPFKNLEYPVALGIFLAQSDMGAAQAAIKHGLMLIELEQCWDWIQELD